MFYLTYASSLLFLLPSPLLFQYLLPNRPYPPSLLCLLIHILFPDPSAPSTHLLPPRPFSPYLESCQRCPEQINSPQRVKIKIPRFHSTPHPPLTTSSLAPDSFKSPRMLTRSVNPAGGPGVTSSRPQDRLRHPLPARHRPFLCKSTQAATTKGPFENLCKSKSRIISNNRWHPIYAVCEASIASHTDCSNLTRLWLQRAAEQTDGVNYPAKEFAGSL